MGHGRAKNRDLERTHPYCGGGARISLGSKPWNYGTNHLAVVEWMVFDMKKWNCCHFGNPELPSSTFVPIILTIFCTWGWMDSLKKYVCHQLGRKSIGNEVRISCLICVCVFCLFVFFGIIIVSYDFQGWWYTGLRSCPKKLLECVVTTNTTFQTKLM